MPDKGLFAFVAIIGFPAIIVLKLYNYDPRLIAGGAVTFMVAYGLLAYRIPQVQLRLDRLGDNFYYLGFIYTLASMSAALIQIQADKSGLDDLIGSFGIALFTTIVGVSGRVLFVQMRSEIDEVEEIVRRDLLSASNDLRAQITLALREFEVFRKSVMQSSTEAFKNAQKAGADKTQQVVEAAETTAERIGAAFDRNDAATRKLNAAINKITDATDSLADRLAQLEIPTDRLNSHLDSFTNELRSLISRLGGTLDMMVAISTSGRRRRRRWYWPFSKRD
jgi:methyl-accepting chemotaxis protein